MTQGVKGKGQSAGDSAAGSAKSALANLEYGLAVENTGLATTSNGTTIDATTGESKVSKDPEARLRSLDSEPEVSSKARKE